MLSYKTIKKIFFVGFFTCVISAAIGSALVIHSLLQLRGIKKLETYTPPTPTEILDINGKLISQFYSEKREIIEFDDIPIDIIQATLSTEDERFMNHYGFNVWRILKALGNNIRAMRAEQGGSTITIQLSKLLFLHHQKKISRKIKELFLAIQLEKRYSKKEIMLFYFNQINYGHGCYGLEIASQFFFNKNAKNLDVYESALLAGIPKSPVYFSPLRYSDNAMSRHETVLRGMVANNYLSVAEAREGYNAFWNDFHSTIRKQSAHVSDSFINHAPYFVEYIRRKLENDLGQRNLYKQGLKIYTTLNLEHQQAAQKYLREALEKHNQKYAEEFGKLHQAFNNKLYNSLGNWSEIINLPRIDIAPYLSEQKIHNTIKKQVLHSLKDMSLLASSDKVNALMESIEVDSTTSPVDEKLEGGLISVEPHTGHITAMVGGSGFNYRNQLNHATDIKRQIGSALKPFIYALAIDKNLITASTMLTDRPTAFGLRKRRDKNIDNNTATQSSIEEDYYIPKNYTGLFKGEISVREAIRRSINTCAVNILHKLGISDVQDYLSKIFSVTTDNSKNEKFPADLTLALGSGIFSPLSIATAYAILANEGKEVIPMSIRYVTDRNGEVLTNYTIKRTRKQLMNPATVYILNSILTDVLKAGGTAFNSKLFYNSKHIRTSAGKTGTSSNWKDAWFVGFNRYLSTCVWMGFDSNKTLGKNGIGGKIAAPVWMKYQQDVLNDLPLLPYKRPINVVAAQTCRYTGLLPGPYSFERDIYTEIYKAGTTPKQVSMYRYEQIQEANHFQNILRNNKPASNNKKKFLSIIEELNQN